MEKTIDVKRMHDELLALRKEVESIKMQIQVDLDTIMTPEEEMRYEKAMKEYNEGRATPLEDLKKELGY